MINNIDYYINYNIMTETTEIQNIYIDGSCINNGSPHAIAGYGVYFQKDDERNEFARVVGKQTNNTGELTAFIRAIEIMYDELNKTPINIKINVYTDSEYVIKCAGSYGDKLSKNDWKTSTGKSPPNLKLIQRAQELYKPFKKNIMLHHVKAHTGFSDEHSTGNAEADRLANLAVGVNVVDSLDKTLISNIKESRYTKHYIDIKYDYRESIKKLGAKWDLNCKKWFYEDNISETNKAAIKEIEIMSKNNTLTEEKVSLDTGVDIELPGKVYVKIPFNNKDAVKKLGCRWDPEKKSWFYMSNHDKNKIESIKKLGA